MKLKMGIFGLLFVAMLIVMPHHAYAAETSNTNINNSTDSTQQEEENDPLYGRANGVIDQGFYDTTGDNSISKKSALYGSQQTTSAYNQNTTYTSDSRFDGKTIHNGIDVSKYQGVIDWSQVKQAGIDFAFIRVAYRGSSNGGLYTDATYIANLQNAAAAGIKVGVYIYSQAISPDEGKEEANYVLNLIKGYNVTLPVIIDYEYATTATNGGRLYAANLSKDTATATVNAFADQVSAAGYTPMIYANRSMLENSLNASNIPHLIWLANYRTNATYTGDYIAWQYYDKGSVAGISTTVDLDYWYGDFTSTNPNSTTVQMYRMYNPNSGEHFYTSTYEEKINLINAGWTYEGIGWTAPKTSSSPVYRLYNANAGDHFYTLSASEKDHLVSVGWKYEGIGWYSDDNKQVTLYREYNPNASVGTHNYTTSASEHSKLVGLGWNDEGTAWYGVNP